MARRLPKTRFACRDRSGGGRLLAIALLCALGIAPSAAAVTIPSSWLAAASGDWDDATQWSTDPNFPNNGSPLATDTYDVTIDATGPPYTVTLDTNITIDNLSLDSSDATVSHTTGTFVVTGTAAVSNGTYAVNGGTLQGGTWNVTAGTLSFAGIDTIVNATVNVDASGARFGADGNGTLTLNSGSTVNLNVASSRITSDILSAGDGTVINQGTIVADGGGGSPSVDIDPDTFVNEGTVTVQNGATLNLSNDWDNDGVINLNDANLRLQDSYTTADIGTIIRTGTTVVHLQGTLDNSGDTLTLDSSTGSYLLNSAEIQGGAIAQLDGETLIIAGASGNRLDNVAVSGGLDLSGFGSQLRLANGSSFTGTATLGPVGFAKLGVEGTETLDNANVLLSGSSSSFGVAGVGMLTLGSNFTVNLTGSNTALTSGVIQAGAGTVVNQGSVSADGGITAAINPDVFNNQGVVEALGGATLTVGCAGCSVSNVSGGTLTGGSWRVVGASNLELFGDPVITTNQADVTLSGATSVFDSLDLLDTNDTTGSLHLLDSRNFTVAGAFTNRGTLELGDGTFTATTFNNQTGGTISGSGTVSAAVESAGTLAPGASAGRIDIDGDLTLLTGSELDLQLGGTVQGSEYDFINVIGTAILAGALSLSFLDGFQNDVLDTTVFTLLDSDADILGAFANVASGGTLSTSDGFDSFLIFYGASSVLGANPFDPQKVVATKAIPEPSTGLLLVAGLTVLAAGRRRRAR